MAAIADDLALPPSRRFSLWTAIRRNPTIAIGGILVAVVFLGLFGSMPTATEASLIVAYCVLMLGVCLLACVVPTRRALRIDPARALTVDV